MHAFSLPGPRPETPAAEGGVAVTARAQVVGIEAVLDPSGALYWPAEETLVVSDLHLETGSSYARSGQMLPPYDTCLTLGRLADAVARHAPRRLIALGDSFHDPFGPERLADDHRALLAAFCRRMEVVWITGNHDHAAAETLGGAAVETLRLGGVTFRHVPGGEGVEVAGHLHPAAHVVVRGQSLKRRCFVGDARRLVMPAFGVLTGGLPVTDAAFAGLWRERPRTWAIGRRRVYPV
ncbi:ligase-associated DNA damage response endonuclease PdeM [Acuticoccus mangrovi]|uniref:Ligase-associated DNA damage response endonuclease PdeM n=1 Tax=Acuticoccus mangrovi TaxID=2796142 RepID=A0A934MF61_9HYPH|nr:ligase-associated DNA damage response endonuclease PdeM [Acuticoccus mangrovi]MBJ3775123.1 ligase-associated DNA damage response endonuclease PdeM [Acuticoccus mangrovi]